MGKITYQDKVQLNVNPDVEDINKGRAVDWNEIKHVVNENDDNIGNLANLNTTNKSNIVGAINEVNNKNNYSTTEQVIGTYKGKPFYSQVITANNVALTSGESFDLPVALYPTNKTQIKELIDAKISVKDEQYSGHIVGQIILTSSGARCRMLDGWGANTNRYITIVYEYTKTTD